MPTSPRHNLRIRRPRDIRLLKHVNTFGMSCPEVMNRLFWANGESLGGVRAWIRRMNRGGYLATEALLPRQLGGGRYVYLTQAGAKLIGDTSRKHRGPWGLDALRRRYAALLFCTNSVAARRKLTTAEFAERFPQLTAKNLPAHSYYVERGDGDTVRLGWIHVNVGSNPQRVTKKLYRLVSMRHANPTWRRELLDFRSPDSVRFTISVITTSQQKKDQILIELDRARAGDEMLRVPVSVVVMPELIPFMLPPVEALA